MTGSAKAIGPSDASWGSLATDFLFPAQAFQQPGADPEPASAKLFHQRYDSPDEATFSRSAEEADRAGDRQSPALRLIAREPIVEEEQVGLLLAHQDDRFGLATVEGGCEGGCGGCVDDFSHADLPRRERRVQAGDAEYAWSGPQYFFSHRAGHQHFVE
jgi:hypothetical protein